MKYLAILKQFPSEIRIILIFQFVWYICKLNKAEKLTFFYRKRQDLCKRKDHSSHYYTRP